MGVLGRAGVGWGGLGRLQGAVLMFGYGFTDLRISPPPSPSALRLADKADHGCCG